MSNIKMVGCPRGCGWETGNPALDEDGMPYTCFFCFNEGVVPEDVAAADLAGQVAADTTLEERAVEAPRGWARIEAGLDWDDIEF